MATTTRDELKKLRLQAMGVVGAQMDASAAMFQRVISAGDKVNVARTAAETAHMAAIQEQVADLTEMADEMAEFAQAAPPTSQAGTASGAGLTSTPSAGSSALAALQSAQPNPNAMNLTSDGAEVHLIPPRQR